MFVFFASLRVASLCGCVQKTPTVTHAILSTNRKVTRVFSHVGLLYSEYSLVFRAGMDRSDYFSFDLTMFDRKGQAFDEEQDESPDSGEIEPLLRSRDQSESYIGVIWTCDFDLAKSARSSVSQTSLRKLRKPMIVIFIIL